MLKGRVYVTQKNSPEVLEGFASLRGAVYGSSFFFKELHLE